MCNSSSAYSQASRGQTKNKMSNDIEREWDEKETSELEPYEESEGELVLRSEKDRVLSRLNRGIHYEHLELSNIL